LGVLGPSRARLDQGKQSAERRQQPAHFDQGPPNAINVGRVNLPPRRGQARNGRAERGAAKPATAALSAERPHQVRCRGGGMGGRQIAGSCGHI
jgi:hypothetical protein